RDHLSRALDLPCDGTDPPAFPVAHELDRVDAALERLRVGFGVTRLVARKDLTDVSEAVRPPRDLALEESGRLPFFLSRFRSRFELLGPLVHIHDGDLASRPRRRNEHSDVEEDPPHPLEVGR